MIITNETGLPQPFVEMVKGDEISKEGLYRVTSLLNGAKQTVLSFRHRNEISQDAAEMVWMLFGTAAHSILEGSHESDDQIKENRLNLSIGERIVSGAFDLYDRRTETVTDYKTCSVWKVIFGDTADWRRQLLTYAYMLRNIGFPVSRGEIVAIMKDHSKRDAKNKADYPKHPVKKFTFYFLAEDFEEERTWLEDRIALLRAAELLSDDEIPTCTPEERWYSGDKFAVMKKGRKSALRVFDTMPEAESWKSINGGDEIVTRPGVNKRCMEYCSCCEFCNFYKENCKESEVVEQ